MARKPISNRAANLRDSINEETRSSLSSSENRYLEIGYKERDKLERKYRKRWEDFTEKEREDSFKKYGRQVESELAHQAKKFSRNVASGLAQVMGKVTSEASSGLSKYLDAYQTGFSNITTRIQGTGKEYNSILKNLQNTLGGTRAVSMTKVLSNLDKLVSQGISYNLEQRTFLSSISDKIAATFDAANGTLTGLIRLNRTDMTGAYLGMENALTKFFNAQFSDTSYLASGLSDQVSSALFAATAQLGADQGAALEYQVQKYLGSFYSSGMTEGTITNIASALGALGSGDLTSLTSNSQMMTLLTGGARNAGISLSQMLTEGLNATTVSQLMTGIFQQAMEIAQSGDKVGQQQLAGMYGMNLTDLKALTSFSNKQLFDMIRTDMSYGDLLGNLDRELNNINRRTSQKEQIDNILDNVLGRVGQSIANNPAMLLTYQILDKIGSLEIFGTDVVGVGKSGIMGMGLLSNIPEMIGMLTSDALGQSAYVSGAASSDITNTIMSRSASELEVIAEHTSQTNKNLESILSEIKKQNNEDIPNNIGNQGSGNQGNNPYALG